MEAITISKRLKIIARFIPLGKVVADIGSDHALLPSYLITEGISPFCIAGEVNDGPLQAARKQISSLKLTEKVAVRKGDGLQVLDFAEVEVITIAGMGGALIVEILHNGRDKLQSIQRLILQPNVGEELVRRWLDQNGWEIIDEEILEEDKRIYEIIVAERKGSAFTTNDYSLDQQLNIEDLYKIGPILWQKKPNILIKKWQNELKKMQYILEQLKNAKTKEENTKKQIEILSEIKWITEVIMCLQKDKISSKFLNS